MSVSTQTHRTVAQLKESTGPIIYNITSPLIAGDEFSQLLPDGTKKILLKTRSPYILNFSFTSGMSEYMTLQKHSSWTESELNLTGKTLYMEVNQPQIIVELLIWT